MVGGGIWANPHMRIPATTVQYDDDFESPPDYLPLQMRKAELRLPTSYCWLVCRYPRFLVSQGSGFSTTLDS
jgi:hypothetical protein